METQINQSVVWFALSVLSHPVAWGVIFAAVLLIIGTCSHLHTQKIANKQFEQSITLSRLYLGLQDMCRENSWSCLAQESTQLIMQSRAFSGSLSFSEMGRLITTYSQITTLITSWSRAHGTRLSEQETLDTWRLVLAQNGLSSDEKVVSVMPKNMQKSRNKKNCLICTKVRDLVGGGGSSETVE